MKARTVKSLVRDGAKNIVLNRLVSIIAITTVFISLTLFGVFFSIIKVTNDNVKNLQDQVKIIAFLDEDFKEADKAGIEGEIKSLEGVESVRFVSSEEGLKDYKNSFEADEDLEMQRILDEVIENGKNPIPASFEVTTADNSRNKELKSKLTNIEGVYKVSDGNSVTEFLDQMNSMIRIVGYVIIGILLVGSIFLISNTIKIAVYTRRREIGIIKYIGATDNYIRLPFVVEGFIIGSVGAIISLFATAGLYILSSLKISSIIESFIIGFEFTAIKSVFIELTPIILLIGSGIGIIGSLLSLRKYLDV